MQIHPKPRLHFSLLLGIASTLAIELGTPIAAMAQERTALGQPIGDYVARRKALMKSLREKFPDASVNSDSSPPCLVLLRGSDTGDREDFEEGRFRQNNNFAYLTGFELPGAYLVLNPAADRDVLYVPRRVVSSTPLGGFSHRASITPEDLKLLGFTEVRETSQILGDLFGAFGRPLEGERRGGGCVVYTQNPNPRPTDHSPESLFIRHLREGARNTEFRDLEPLIAGLRVIKTPAELALLQKAIDITGQAEHDVAVALEPGKYEYQLEAKLMHAFLDGGALRPGFASIVGSGPNACIPHYFENTRRIENNDLVVVDIGAEYQYYTADITRTFPANGKFSPRQRELYQAVLDAQKYAADRVEPGKTRLGEMTGWVQQYLRKHPLRAKDAQGQDQTLDRFFIHGLGHYLGMDVHDVGDYARTLEKGMVFTIEPGLYIPYENIGIRIEDDYVITDKGIEKMSAKIPSEPDEIEKLMSKRGSGGKTDF